jgi:hypothetical protein
VSIGDRIIGNVIEKELKLSQASFGYVRHARVRRILLCNEQLTFEHWACKSVFDYEILLLQSQRCTCLSILVLIFIDN